MVVLVAVAVAIAIVVQVVVVVVVVAAAVAVAVAVAVVVVVAERGREVGAKSKLPSSIPPVPHGVNREPTRPGSDNAELALR